MKMSGDAKHSSLMASPSTTEYEAKEETPKISQNVNSYSGQFAFAGLKNLDSGCFGSVTKDIKGLTELKAQAYGQLFRNNPLLSQMFENAEENLSKPMMKMREKGDPLILFVRLSRCSLLMDNSIPRTLRGYAKRTIQVEERVGLAVESDFENYEDVGVEENKVRGYAERTIQVEEKVSLDGESDAEKDKGVGVGENKVSAYAEETMQIEDKVCMVKLLSRKIGVFMLVLKKMMITKPRLKAMI
ncbi:hypothetical protein Pint_34168 [Pistacia integerrima]|uniref:Uncharacterized protein n=1 Tax=Pistacia integerrima TaxID=434235 RepID=A0ACC0X6D3_9ROSI|nr:hypothetical protein Pint_34168 [Pistacia integerrima]